MYVYLGGEQVVLVTDVVAVLDTRMVSASAVNQEFLRRAEASGRIRGEGVTAASKSLVVMRDHTVYASGISPGTLTRRMTHRQQSTGAWEAET